MAAANPNITYVRYFVPYDGDTEEHPNVFIVRKPIKGLTLGDIQSVRLPRTAQGGTAESNGWAATSTTPPPLQAFPLPGSYLFRAKQAYAKAHVWLDLVSSSSPVPVFNGVVILKVSRLSADPSTAAPPPAASAAPSAPAPARVPPPVASAPTAAAPPPRQAAAVADASADVLGLFDAAPPAASASAVRPAAVTPGGPSSSSSGDIFSLSADSPVAAAGPPSRAGGGLGAPAAHAAAGAGQGPARVTPGMALGGGLARGQAQQPQAARPQGGGGGGAAANILAGDVFSM